MKRKVDGILILDKPLAASSNKALQIVKRLFNAKKAGHTGSLDPIATGVLPLCFGEATKFSSFLLDADKSYRVKAKLGVRTTTSDIEGDIVSTMPVPAISLIDFDKMLDEFRGKIKQVPSMFSALKKDGVPLYKLARKGLEVERKARDIEIYNISVIELDHDSFTLDVSCSKGTYIRTLVEDIGNKIGCGAHVVELRRTKAGPFAIEESITISELEILSLEELDAKLVAIDCHMEFAGVDLNDSETKAIQMGQQIRKPAGTGMVKLMSEGSFIGLGESLAGIITPKRLVANS